MYFADVQNCIIFHLGAYLYYVRILIVFVSLFNSSKFDIS